MSNTLKSYFTTTNNMLYSYLLAVPLLLLYEALIIISQPASSFPVRISVDVWFKSFFELFGLNSLTFTLIVAVGFGIYVFSKEREQVKSLRYSFFPILLIESTIFAVVVSMISQSLVGLLVGIAQNGGEIVEFSILQQIALSLGAGLYEELFFRVILVSLLVWLFSFMFSKKWASNIAAVVLAAMLFSAVHYIGSFGDPFTIGSFMYRFIFGLFLNVIYVTRGFGVAAWTHAIYDLLVILVF